MSKNEVKTVRCFINDDNDWGETESYSVRFNRYKTGGTATSVILRISDVSNMASLEFCKTNKKKLKKNDFSFI